MLPPLYCGCACISRRPVWRSSHAPFTNRSGHPSTPGCVSRFRREACVALVKAFSAGRRRMIRAMHAPGIWDVPQRRLGWRSEAFGITMGCELPPLA